MELRGGLLRGSATIASLERTIVIALLLDHSVCALQDGPEILPHYPNPFEDQSWPNKTAFEILRMRYLFKVGIVALESVSA